MEYHARERECLEEWVASHFAPDKHTYCQVE